MQDRSERRLCCRTNSSSLSLIPYFQESRCSLPIQNTCLWDECESPYFLKIDEVCDGTVEEGRNQNGLLLRRCLPACEISSRNGNSERASKITFGKFGFFDKQREEHTNTSSTTRVPRIFFQLKDDEDHHSFNKVEQVDNQNSTSLTTNQQNLQMVCQSFGEDDFSNTCNRESFTTHTTFTARPCLQPSPSSSTMGINFSYVEKQQRRIGVVDTQYQEQEWIVDSENQQHSTCIDHSRRCFGYSLGCGIKRISNYRVLDTRRKGIFYKRKRTDGYMVRLTTARTKMSKHNHKNIHRQYYSFKIRHKIWRHFFNTLARPRSSNSGYLQPVSTTSTIPTYSWGSEHIGRLHQPSADSESIVRSNATETTIQQTSENVGPSTDRRVCLSSESPAEYVLESTSGPSSSSNRRVQPNLVEEGNVLISTMEIYTSSNSEDQTTKDRRRSPSYPKLANSILVSDASQDATTSNTNDPQGTKVAADRLEVIRKKTKNLGMTEDSVEFLQHSLRANTLKLYNNGWRLWTKWCNDQDPTIDPEKYDTDNVFKFLVAHRNYSVSHLNGIRSSIASTFKILHPNLPPLASQTKIEEFFKAKRNLEIKLPRPGQLGTWDTDIICQYIKENWSDNSTLSLHTPFNLRL